MKYLTLGFSVHQQWRKLWCSRRQFHLLVRRIILKSISPFSPGVGAETIARAVLLQKAMVESGMAMHEIANAMTLVMTIDPQEEKIKQLKEALKVR